MPKPRSRHQGTPERLIDAFIHEPEAASPDTLDPDAPRKFKTVTIPLNAYEYGILKDACKKSGRSAKNLFRYAMIQYAEMVLE